MNVSQNLANIPWHKEFNGFGDTATVNTATKMKDIINSSAKNPYIRRWAEKILSTKNVKSYDWIGEVEAIHNWVRDNIRYTHDPAGIEYLQTPPTLLMLIEQGERPMGDCITGDTKIIVKNKETNTYELKPIQELELCYNKYEALSYNFDRKKWEFKNILNFQYKGKKETLQVRFDNGSYIKCTHNHKLFNATLSTNNKIKNIEAREISNIGWNLPGKEKSLYNRVCCAIRIPSLNINTNKSKEYLWIEGIYVAEGSYGNSSICQDKKDVREEIDKNLELAGIKNSGHWTREHSGEKYVKLDNIKDFGLKCHTKKFLNEHLSMSVEDIKNILDGYTKGDGHVPTNEKSSWYGRIDVMYTTNSMELADQLTFLHLILGKPLYKAYVNKPSNYSIHPCWRLYCHNSEKPQGYRRERLNDVAFTSIVEVFPIGIYDVYDIEVEDTHNFVTSDGIILHNCDDMSMLTLSLLKSIGYEVGLKVTSYKPNGTYQHVYGIVRVPIGKTSPEGYSVQNIWLATDTIKPDKNLGWEATNPTRTFTMEV